MGYEAVDVDHVSAGPWLAQHSNNDVVDMATAALVIRKPGLRFYITLKYARSWAGSLVYGEVYHSVADRQGAHALTTARRCGFFKHLQYSEVLGWISNFVPTTRATIVEVPHSTDKIDRFTMRSKSSYMLHE